MLVSAVITDARDFQIPAIAEVSSSAGSTGVVLAAVPADAGALSLLPSGNTGAHFIDDARHLMSGSAGILNPGPKAFFREAVTVANTTRLHLDPDLSGTRLRNLALDDLEIGSRLGNLCYFHRSNCEGCRCHMCSRVRHLS